MKAIYCDINKSIFNIGFVFAVLVTALLCFTAEIYNDLATSKSYSVFEAIFTLDKELINSDFSFCSISVFGKALSGYITMFLPISCAFPFVISICAERNSGNMRLVIMRTGRIKYYLSKFTAATFGGGLSTALGVAVYGIATLILFPPLSGYEISPEEMELFFPHNSIIVALKMLLSAFLYGCVSVLPAFFLSSFCRNPYIVLCLPFMVVYIWTTALNKMISNAIQSGNTELYLQINPFYPSAISKVPYMTGNSLITTLVFNVILVTVLLIGYIFIMEKRSDKGC